MMDWLLVGAAVLLVAILLMGLRRKQIEDPGAMELEEEETGTSWAVIDDEDSSEETGVESAAAKEEEEDGATSEDAIAPDDGDASDEAMASDEDIEVDEAPEAGAAEELAPVEQEESEEQPSSEEEVESSSPFGQFLRGLKRSRDAFTEGLGRFFGSHQIDEAALESLEDTLVGADIGVRAAMEITEAVRTAAKDGEVDDLKGLLRTELLRRLGEAEPLSFDGDGPRAILVVGVNGSGKTTTIGKLAARYQSQGKKVVLAAGDTFRAGAIEQIKVWGERSDVPVIAHQEGSDPAAVIFDALQAAQARGADIVICDTAGRLQAQQSLMDELAKVVRVMAKALPGAPHEVLLVLDSTIGQNAVSQARSFKEVVGVTGIALTKLDGTARGGVVVAICDEMKVPVKLVGLGEGIDDLRDFEPSSFVDALMGQ